MGSGEYLLKRSIKYAMGKAALSMMDSRIIFCKYGNKITIAFENNAKPSMIHGLCRIKA